MNELEKVIEVGECRVRIFGSVIETKTGPVTVRSVSLQRGFVSKDGKLGTAYSLRENDVPKAIMALSRAYEFMVEEGVRARRERGQVTLGKFDAGE